jgi:sterol desaturase/sphingolipid hydroxylase (fatty acid hydroxylase superfamily)
MELWKHRLSNWGCGALTVAAGVGLALVARPLWSQLALLRWPGGWAGAALAFVALDVLYYLQHRAEHSNRWMWAVHSVHHQSTICDASVSLRTSALAPLTVFAFHLPLAVLGLPLGVYVAAYVVHTALVVMLHTRTPKWMHGPARLLNGPHLHRGHHSNAPRLRGKNLGGVFIVWDRLFGTFEGDCSNVETFGIGSKPTPLSPVEANVAPLRALLATARAP